MLRNSLVDLDFGLPEQIVEIRETVDRWLDEKLVLPAYPTDHSNEFPAALWTELGAQDRFVEIRSKIIGLAGPQSLTKGDPDKEDHQRWKGFFF